jgi:hypothetical protein
VQVHYKWVGQRPAATSQPMRVHYDACLCSVQPSGARAHVEHPRLGDPSELLPLDKAVGVGVHFLEGLGTPSSVTAPGQPASLLRRASGTAAPAVRRAKVGVAHRFGWEFSLQLPGPKILRINR